jgi:patatin-like phospholipase/acyl hydrolase
MPAMVLAELERRTGRPTAELFDLIAGTSTGGIIALVLACPGAHGRPAWSAEQLVELYEFEGAHIFEARAWDRVRGLGGMIHERYAASGLEQLLERYCGNYRLTDTVTDVLIPAYEVLERRPFLFESASARSDPAADYPLKVAARATSAAPTYFEPLEVMHELAARAKVFVDGGLYANNPAMLAFTESQTGRLGRGELLMVSLGTGEMTRELRHEQIRHWGVAQWARPILHVVLDGVSMSVNNELSQLLGPESYWRFQTILTEARDDIDDVRPENIAKLKAQASALIRDRSGDLDHLAERLDR